jgi:hypothetical protein
MMKVPGEAYVLFEPTAVSPRSMRLRSTALFGPRGLWGRLYWWLLLTVHKFIFTGLNMANGVST